MTRIYQMTECTEEKYYSNQCKICYQRKNEAWERIRKEEARIVLGITHNNREYCFHLLVDWWSQDITPGYSSQLIMYIALGGKSTNPQAKLTLLDIFLSVQKKSLAIALTFTKVSECFKFQFYFTLEQIFFGSYACDGNRKHSISLSLISRIRFTQLIFLSASSTSISLSYSLKIYSAYCHPYVFQYLNLHSLSYLLQTFSISM